MNYGPSLQFKSGKKKKYQTLKVHLSNIYYKNLIFYRENIISNELTTDAHPSQGMNDH